MSTVAVRGRPVVHAKQDEQKAKLLAAAQKLLIEKSYRSVTIRELAETADVNSAMIGYYFKNKEGLFIALMDKMSEQLFITMQQVQLSDNPLRSFIEMMITKFSINRGFARLIYDEFMTSDSQLGHDFMERFPKRMSKMLPLLIIKNTAITDPIKANYAAFSLMMLIITPFIAGPVRKVGWGISDQEIKSPAWSEHIYKLFMLGCSEEIN